ncbi:transposase-like protein DUF772 [Fluviicoccus keumensis]|uniref:Transposase-like protein DUF772 n=1 Tax=Fluviicoccus keumensis TaxID=1435465 RepID=A0A4Q7Z920_9GAMM|nr:transposase [Fluviicoccus keumensis]RZU47027.1 transposase-like protein DUF772 [Fluviicoccus keumensis]
MRGSDSRQGALFSFVDLDSRITAKHSIRKLPQIVDTILTTQDSEFFARYSETGRPSIPPEQLLRTLLLQVMYSICSERQLVEQLDYNLIFCWCVGIGVDDPVSPTPRLPLQSGGFQASFECMMTAKIASLNSMPNLRLKRDNGPADYGAIFLLGLR